MHAQREDFRWSIASPAEIERTARELMRLRDDFLAAPALRPSAGRPVIRRSWERCRSMQVDAAKRAAPLYVTRDSEIDELLEANGRLLRAAAPVTRRLADHLADSGYVAVVADAGGRVLDIAGDPGIRRRLERIDFMAGGEWCEATAGTNAIGTCLQDRRPVQLLAAEHFCDGWTNLTCTAVPITDPRTGAIVGVLNLTGDYRLIRAHLISLVAVNAREISERLATRLPAERSYSVPPLDTSDADGTHDAYAALDVVGGEIGASLDLKETLSTVARQTAALLGLERAAVFLFSEHRPSGLSCVCWNRKGNVPLTSETTIGLFARSQAVAELRERGVPIILDEVDASTMLSAPLALALGVRAVALLPLATARGIIGFLAAPRALPHEWNVHELRRAVALAGQAATAIENSRLFEALRKRNRHIETVNAVAEFLGRLHAPEQHLDEILRHVAEVMGADAGLLYLRQPGRDRLRLHARYGVAEDAVPAERDCPVAPRAPQLLGAAAAEERAGAALPAGYATVLNVPLEHGATLHGVLELGMRRAHRAHKDDLATLAAIGLHVSMALTNQRLLRSATEVEALRQADALKSEFLATVSHDLRSPLTAIRASVEGLLDPRACRPFDEAEDLLHNIASQATRLSRLVDQLLDVSLIEAGRLVVDREWNELSGILGDASTGLATLYGRNRIVYDVPPGDPILFVDRDLMVQVVYNLLDNACKYGPPDTPVRIHARWDDAEMRISVIDQGAGVPPGDREKVFARFYRGDVRKQGTRSIGLGLAICRGIVDAHGGRIWVEDSCGGNAFRFTIPLATERADRFANAGRG